MTGSGTISQTARRALDAACGVVVRSRIRALLAFAIVGMNLLSAQPRTMGLILNDSAAFNGYTLFAPMLYNVTYLIDNQGRYIHSWPSVYRPGYMAYLLADGSLLRSAFVSNSRFIGYGGGGRIEIINWDSSLDWSFNYSSNLHYSHHDVKRLPNGNVIATAWEYKSYAQSRTAGRAPELLPDNSLWPDHLIEVDPSGTIVWEWHVWDHLIQDRDPDAWNYGVVRDHPELIDLNCVPLGAQADMNHCNAVAYNPDLDQLAISSRSFSEIWVIDHSTTTEEARGHSGGRHGRGGDLLYRWGNPAVYGRGTSADRRLYHQHDIQWIAPGLPGADHFLVFNNGAAPEHAWSSVDEFVPPVDSPGFYHLPPDSAFGPAGPVWTFRDSTWFFSTAISGCERQPNGNTLVCAGMQGTLFEVTPDQRLVWKYINPVCDTGPMFQYESIPPMSNHVFKTRRYAPDYEGLRGRNLTPGGPIERYPPAVGAGPDLPLPDAGLVVRRVSTHREAAVTFSLPVSGRATLAVYDLSGKRIATLLAGHAIAGRHEVNWKSGNAASGIYFLRLEQHGRMARARVLLMD
jgi:hypothetical protein